MANATQAGSILRPPMSFVGAGVKPARVPVTLMPVRFHLRRRCAGGYATFATRPYKNRLCRDVLKDRGYALPNANAHRCQAISLPGSMQLVDQGAGEPRPGAAEWMSQRYGPT